MTKAGCSIQSSAIYKIEKSDPPRRITVDELVAFSQVFGVSVERLLLPPELVAADELTDLVLAWDRASDESTAAQQQETEAWEKLRSWVDAHPEYSEKVESVIRHWSEYYFEGDHEFRVAHKMWKLTGEDAWGQRLKAALDAELAES